MELFRITRQKYVADLSGKGAFERGGRWNSPGKYALYTAQSRSLAMVESLVYLSGLPPDDDYKIAVLYVPDAVFMATVDVGLLAPNWRDDQKRSRHLGDQWLTEHSSLLLRAPSIIVRSEHNYMINPGHASADQIKLVAIEPFSFDWRLFNR